MKYITLANGLEIPLLGYGTLQISPSQAESCVLEALQEGYRLIDSAAAYFNEEGIGRAVRKSGIDRKEIFLTSKVWIQDTGYENTIRAFETSAKNLGVDYIDLYLIHQPYGDYYGSWRALEDLYDQKKIRAIGVCNFSAERFVDLCLNSRISPMINQIECHPFFWQKDLISTLSCYQCAAEAWGPLAEGQRQIFNHPILSAIGQKYHKTAAQVTLRWLVQQNIITIPKTVHRQRMKENMQIWDFELSLEDFQKIAQLNLGYSEIINHQSPMTAKWLNKYKIHE